MNSIIEEASSIAKAIDQAWQRAEKPQEFSVKIFEEPQRNMFGLTVKSAKIALFFDEKATISHTSLKRKSPEVQTRPVARQRHDSPQKNTSRSPVNTRQEKAPAVQRPLVKEQDRSQANKPQPRKQRPVWSHRVQP